MSSDAQDGPMVCPKCGSQLTDYGDGGRECLNDECRWVDPLGGGDTVAGSTDDDLGDEETTLWPSELPRDIYSGAKQRAVIQASVRNPDVTEYLELANIVGCSRSTVGKAFNKARVFVAPEQTVLPVPEQPSYQTVVDRVIDHPQAVFGREDFALFDGAGQTAVEQAKAIRDGEIEGIRARALAGESPSEIADDYSADRKTIYDRVVGRAGDDTDSDIEALEYDREQDTYVLPADEPAADGREDSITVCPECPVYWESAPESWGRCPRCGTELIAPKSAEAGDE